MILTHRVSGPLALALVALLAGCASATPIMHQMHDDYRTGGSHDGMQPHVLSRAGSKWRPDVSPEVSPESFPEESPEVSPDMSPEVSPEESPEVSPDMSPEVSPEESPEVSPDMSP
jgi:hypothetical protein